MNKERDLLPRILGAVLLTTVATSAASAQAAATPAPHHASQIWECNIAGRRVFADSPCGAHASIHELSPMNTMPASSPVAIYYPSPSRAYLTASPGYRDGPDATDGQPDSQQLGAVYYYNGVARRRHPGRHGDHGHVPHGYHH